MKDRATELLDSPIVCSMNAEAMSALSAAIYPPPNAMSSTWLGLCNSSLK